ncbi:MAG: aminotransferase class I/II-fold pyridoxal phosphate-dependent enzyme [Acidimicrobiia bacterium]
MKKALSPTRGDRMLRLFQRHADRARANGMSRQLIEDVVLEGDSIILDDQRLINFGLCSYLGLGDDERLKEGARDAIERYGTSYSSTVAYTALPLYQDLKVGLEAMMGANVVVAPTTTLAHLAALPVLIRPGDEVIVDAMAHASVQTATQLLQASGIPVSTVAHNDVAAARDAVEASQARGRIWLLVDGVYSMHGDLTPVADLMELLESHSNLYLYCDDAHGFGWDGAHGRGAFLARGKWHERLVIAAGLSKSFGATGGIVAMADPELADLVELCGPPLMFGGPIPPAALGAGVASTQIHLSSELDERQTEFKKRIDHVNERAQDLGIPLASFDRTPIWYLDIGDYDVMTDLFTGMRTAGFFLNASAFPVVPMRHAGVRFTITLYNTIPQIDDMLESLLEQYLRVSGETHLEIDLTSDVPVTRIYPKG